MNEQEIRLKYQRDDENDLRGTNILAMDRFIEMLKLHEKSDDLRIRSIADNFDKFGKISPNFTIFEDEKCAFMHQFKAYQISKDTNMLVASHEFGHAVLSIANNLQLPDDYENVIERAKKHALSQEHKEEFKEYVQYLCDRTEQRGKRSEAEKKLVADIISSIFQSPGLRIGSNENVCILPAYHLRGYYYDEESKTPNVKNIFDEDFANYYTLKVNNCDKEIETLKSLFGEELINVLDNQLQIAYERLDKYKSNENKENITEQIKGTVVYTRQGEIDQINEKEKPEIDTDRGDISE